MTTRVQASLLSRSTDELTQAGVKLTSYGLKTSTTYTCSPALVFVPRKTCIIEATLLETLAIFRSLQRLQIKQ
eukprot:5506391-Amphidinium_carterae.1